MHGHVGRSIFRQIPVTHSCFMMRACRSTDTMKDYIEGLEAHHVRYTYARGNSDNNHTSKLVKRGGFFWRRTLIFVRISYKVSQNLAIMRPTNSSMNTLLTYEFILR